MDSIAHVPTGHTERSVIRSSPVSSGLLTDAWRLYRHRAAENMRVFSDFLNTVLLMVKYSAVSIIIGARDVETLTRNEN
jgi:hypothetical protein